MVKGEEKRIVLFQIGFSDYGIDIKDIFEIVKVPAIHKLPQVKNYLLGVINLRGNIIPVIDLKKRCLDEDTKISDDNRVIIAQSNGSKVGFLVEEVKDIIELKKEDVTDANELTLQLDEKLLDGIAEKNKQMVFVLNIEKLI